MNKIYMKLVFGEGFIEFYYDENWTFKKFKNLAKKEIRKNMNINDAHYIEFVQQKAIKYAELSDKIPNNFNILSNINNFNNEVIYYRPIYILNNIRYLKSTFNNIDVYNNIEYKFIKYKELDKLKRGLMNKSELNVILEIYPISVNTSIINEIHDNCVICYNELSNTDERINRYQCEHNNICNLCFYSWHNSNRLTCPLCRSVETLECQNI